MSCLPARMKKIQSKMKALEFQQDYMSFLDAQGQPTLKSEIPPNFKLIQAFMVVLLTCKDKEDPIKNEAARVL